MQKLRRVRNGVFTARSNQLSALLILPRQPSSTLRKPSCTSASFSTTPRPAAGGSPLFHLAALSNARETQWASNASGLSRVEHSTNLQLLRSEAELCPADPMRPSIQWNKKRIRAASPLLSKVIGDHLGNGTIRHGLVQSRKSAGSQGMAADNKALSIGRAILHRHAQQVQRFRRLIRNTKFSHKKEVQGLEAANRRLSRDNKAGSLWILLSMAVATGLALWRYSPTAVSASKWREKWRVADVAPSGAETGVMDIVPAGAPVVEKDGPAEELVFVEKEAQSSRYGGNKAEGIRSGNHAGGWRRKFWAE